MQQATINVQYVNQPRGNGPGSVKDDQGLYWKVWPTSKKPGGATLDDFVAGGTYSVTYSTEMYQGKENRTITSVTQTAAASNGAAPRTNGHPIAPRQRTDPTDAERMFVCANLVAFIKAGKCEPDLATLVGDVNMLRDVWKNTFGADA